MTEDPWAAVDAVLPKGWTIGRPSFYEEERRWHVWAIGPHPVQRLRAPEQTGGEGTTEAEALMDLARELRRRSG